MIKIYIYNGNRCIVIGEKKIDKFASFQMDVLFILEICGDYWSKVKPNIVCKQWSGFNLVVDGEINESDILKMINRSWHRLYYERNKQLGWIYSDCMEDFKVMLKDYYGDLLCNSVCELSIRDRLLRIESMKKAMREVVFQKIIESVLKEKKAAIIQKWWRLRKTLRYH